VAKRALTKTKLRSLLNLKGEDFYWKVDSARIMMHSKAGTMRKDGVVQIQIEGKMYLKHRLIHFYKTGLWPERKTYAPRVQRTDRDDSEGKTSDKPSES
jgi:hypothetical protein